MYEHITHASQMHSYVTVKRKIYLTGLLKPMRQYKRTQAVISFALYQFCALVMYRRVQLMSIAMTCTLIRLFR